MSKIIRKIKLFKLRRLVDKRNKAFFEGDYEKAIEYGKMFDEYLVNFVEGEEL